MRENITTQISEELKFILTKFFDEHEVDMFVQNIVEDILILTSINSFDRGGEGNSFASGSFFTSRIRSIADRIMTFAREKLDDNKYNNFLLEFGKLMITEGEFFLAMEIFSNALQYSKQKEDLKPIEIEANINLAIINIHQSNWIGALSNAEAAKILLQGTNDQKGMSQCEHVMGAIAFNKGEIKNAKSMFQKGLSYLDKDKDLLLVGKIEISLGNIYASEGNHDEALKYYHNCLLKFQELGDKRRSAEVRNNIGMVYINQKEYEYALYEFDECIKLGVEGRYLPILGMAYVNKAMVYIEINEVKLSAFYASKAMDICYQVNNTVAIAEIYKLKGMIARKQFEFQLSEEYLKASLRLNSELKNELNFAETAVEIGLLYKELNINKSYDYYFNKAFEYYQSIDAKDKIAEIIGYMN